MNLKKFMDFKSVNELKKSYEFEKVHEFVKEKRKIIHKNKEEKRNRKKNRTKPVLEKIGEKPSRKTSGTFPKPVRKINERCERDYYANEKVLSYMAGPL